MGRVTANSTSGKASNPKAVGWDARGKGCSGSASPKVRNSCPLGSRAAQWHAEELAQLQAEVGMLRCHTEWMGPRLPPAILPPPVAPQLLPNLAPPQLFTVRASSQCNLQVSREGDRVGLPPQVA